MDGGGDQIAKENASFFRVLLPGFDKKLAIPRTFYKHMTIDHCQKAIIASPLGNSHVKLEEKEGWLYFGKGWQEFTKAHELGVGYFLVFSYEGDINFNVKVFDLTTCLKEYTPITQNVAAKQKETDLDDPELNIHSNARIIEPDTPSGRGASKTPQAIERPPSFRLKTRKGNCFSAERPHSFTKIIKKYNLSCWYMEVPKGFCDMNGLLKRIELYLKDPKGRSWCINFCPSVRVSYLGKGWREFCQANQVREGDRCIFEHEIEGKKNILHVQILRGKLAEKMSLAMAMSSNAKGLEAANKEQPHDEVLQNVVVKKMEEVRNVSKNSKVVEDEENEVAAAKETNLHDSKQFALSKDSIMEPETHLDQESAKTPQAIERPPKFRLRGRRGECFFAERPHCFKKIIRRFNVSRWFLDIPKGFCDMNGLFSRTEVLLKDSNGRLWSINFSPGMSSSYFGKGWKDFCKANQLREGDTCTFELASGGKNVIHVQIHRGKLAEWKSMAMPSKAKALKAVNREQTVDKVLQNEVDTDSTVEPETQLNQESERTPKAIEEPPSFRLRARRGSCFTAERPHSFNKIIKHFNISRAFLDVPKGFCEMNGLFRRTEFFLNDSEGRSWSIIFSPGSHSLGRGWMEFCVGNLLREGDRCIFELASEGKNIMHVQIHRATNKVDNTFSLYPREGMLADQVKSKALEVSSTRQTQEKVRQDQKENMDEEKEEVMNNSDNKKSIEDEVNAAKEGENSNGGANPVISEATKASRYVTSSSIVWPQTGLVKHRN